MRWALGTAAVLAGVAAAAVIVLLGGESPEELPDPGRGAVRVDAEVEPRRHLFGDAVFARVDVVVDRSRIDPAAVSLRARFDPFEPVAPLRTERKDAGRLTRLRFTAQLRCLGDGCLPPATGQPFALAPAAVLVEGEPAAEIEWPAVAVGSRLSEGALAPGSPGAEGGWRADVTELPPPTYGIAPEIAVASLAALAGALVAAAAALLAAALRRRTAGAPALPALERALLLLEIARRGAELADERKALDLLAVELSKRGEGDLARLASELAWGRLRPEAETTDTLAERIAELADGNGRRA